MFSNKKIIEIVDFTTNSSSITLSEGIPKNIIRSILPILKAYGYTCIIMRVTNNEFSKDIIKSYNSIGIENINNCLYPRFIVDMIDSISKMDEKNISKVLKSPSKVIKLKDAMIEEWSLSDNYKESKIIFVGNIDIIKNKLDQANVPSITNFS